MLIFHLYGSQHFSFTSRFRCFLNEQINNWKVVGMGGNPAIGTLHQRQTFIDRDLEIGLTLTLILNPLHLNKPRIKNFGLIVFILTVVLE